MPASTSERKTTRVWPSWAVGVTARSLGRCGPLGPQRDTAASRGGFERRGDAGPAEPLQQREVHPADELRLALGDGVERAVAHPGHAVVVVGLIAALAQQRLQV